MNIQTHHKAAKTPSYVNQAQRPGFNAIHPGQLQQLQLSHIVIMKIQRGLEGR